MHPHTEVFSQWNGKAGKESNVEIQTSDGTWTTPVVFPTWLSHVKYRIKKPKFRPWNYEELKEFFLSGKCLLKRDEIHRPTSFHGGWLCSDAGAHTAEELLKYCTQEDGSPCGVIDD